MGLAREEDEEQGRSPGKAFAAARPATYIRRARGAVSVIRNANEQTLR